MENSGIRNSNGLPTTGYSGKKVTRSNAIVPAVGIATGSAGLIKTSEAEVNMNSASMDKSKSAGEEFEGSKDQTSMKRDKNQIGLPLIVHSATVPGKVKGNDSLLNKFSASKKGKPEKSLRVNRSLNFGLTFGPDYTDAGGITNNQLGNNIGLTVGYYLTSKLSVNTGIIYSNKFYWSEGRAYNQPAYTQSGSINTYAAAPAIELVNGSCNMWEIPLTLRYDFAKNKKTRFFANAGVSSYFMMKQSYIYFFHSGIRPLALKASNNEQINYWFDVASISAGWETEIGRGFSFQIEPFMKLPFKNIGSENLKLNSYGVLLSFRYSPVLSRTKK